MGLRYYVETGTKIDAAVSAELLETIFTPPFAAPRMGHRDPRRRDRGASCILPLSQTRGLSPLLGTRHRAALGLAEETDAAVIVVSEETGAISIAQGRARRNLDEGQLRGELAAIFNPRPDETPEPEEVTTQEA